MSRKDRPIPYWVSRFYYWLDISYPLCQPYDPASVTPVGAEYSLAEYGQENTRANAYAILDCQDNSLHPEYRPALRLELNSMNLYAESDRRVRALLYWISLDRLWYEDPEAQALLRTLPTVKQQALLAFNQRHWARPSLAQKWETLLPRIAKDQIIFRDIVQVGPKIAGVEPASDPAIARQRSERYGCMSRTEARKIYLAYSRQASILLGRGSLPPKAWAALMKGDGLLNARGRIHAAPLGVRGTLNQFLVPERVDTPYLPDWQAVFHWFAHALRNLCRYQNGHAPLPWPDDHLSCQRACERELQKLLA
jgi:hypothetical protein